MLDKILVAVALVASPLFAADAVSPAISKSQPQQPLAPQKKPTTQPAARTLEELQQENQQLKAELAELETTLATLRAAAPRIRYFDRIRVGMTKAELFEFLRTRKNRIRVAHDDVVSTNMERVMVNYWGMVPISKWVITPDKIHEGLPTGGLNDLGRHPMAERYDYIVRRVGSAVIDIENGRVVNIVAN